MRHLLPPFLALLILGRETAASEKEPTAQMEEVVVTGRRVVDPTAQSTLILTEPYRDRQVSLPDVLQSAAGVNVRRFGGLGSFATISIRGSSSEQVQVYLDGIPLNTIQGSGIDLSTLPLDLIESIEVFRGQTPAEFGGSGIGGIVDIRTHQTDGTTHTRLKSTGGSFQTATGSGLHSGKRAGLRYLLGLDAQHTLGNFPYRDDNGTPFNRDDDEIVHRNNNRSFSGGGLANIEYEFGPKTLVEFSLTSFDKNQGIPGLGNFRSESARLSTERRTGRISLGAKGILGNRGESHVALFSSFLRQAFKDPDGEIGVASQDNSNRTLSFGANHRLHAQIGSRQRGVLLTEVRRETFSPRDNLFPNPLTAGRRTSATAVIQDEIEWVEDRLSVVPALRLESAWDRAALVEPNSGTEIQVSDRRMNSNVTGRLGAKFALMPVLSGVEEPDLSLSANAGQYHRNPDFTELYGDRGFLVGNPNLRPESGFNGDVGLRYRRRASGPLRLVHASAAAFVSRIDDLIQFVQNSQQVGVAENFRSVRIWGLESEFESEWLGLFDWALSATLQRPTDTSTIPHQRGKTVPGRPLHEVSSRMSVFRSWARIFYELEFTEGNYLDRANFLLVPPRFLHNAGLSVPFLKRFTATAEVKNLADNRLADYNGFPLPGRSWFGTLTADF